MAQNELPNEVYRLIDDHIVSVEQLEILLLVSTRSEIEWTAQSVSDEVRTSPRSAAAHLADLQTRGFLGVRNDDGAARYRYEPSAEWQRRAVELLAKCYAERRYTVIDLIFAKPIDHLKVYADAFRIKKGDSDG